MLANAPIDAFVPVADLEVAEQFYVHTLGLAVVEKHEYALVVENAAGQILRCVCASDAKPQPFTVVGWSVKDIHASAKEFAGRGIAAIDYPHVEQDADGVWSAPNGAKVLWFHDPDGNVLSLSEAVAGR